MRGRALQTVHDRARCTPPTLPLESHSAIWPLPTHSASWPLRSHSMIWLCPTHSVSCPDAIHSASLPLFTYFDSAGLSRSWSSTTRSGHHTRRLHLDAAATYALHSVSGEHLHASALREKPLKGVSISPL